MKEQYKRKVLIWLITGALLVGAMVIIGGITRLTQSGLSMVDWKPLTGILPPLDDSEWNAEFDNYKKFPEYQILNSDFNLSDFKSIYWWEYIHRILGRFLGLVFIFPFAFFLARKAFNRVWLKRLLILFILGGFQGFLGWFMVKSGLIDNPAVSHYRLAAHLISAFGVFSYILWLILKIINPNISVESKLVKKLSLGMLSLLILQILYGAFVAGLKAGHIYNTYPKMGADFISHIIPSSFDKDGFISLIQEPSTVQFFHRHLPILLLIVILIMLFQSKTKIGQLSSKVILAAWFFQFILGVLALLYNVPIFLGVVHQFGALIILSLMVIHLYRIGLLGKQAI